MLNVSDSVYIFMYGQHFFIDTYLIEHYRHFLSILSSCCINLMISAGNWLINLT